MILSKIADYLTDLMNYTPEKILIGRENATQKMFETDYIIVDMLSPGQVLTSLTKYNADTEIMTINNILKGTFTLEFYGNEAYSNVYKFLALQNSQLSKDLETKYQIMVGKGENINNTKQQAGGRYYNRYEVEVTIQYNELLEIDTYKITSIPLELMNEEEKTDFTINK